MDNREDEEVDRFLGSWKVKRKRKRRRRRGGKKEKERLQNN